MSRKHAMLSPSGASRWLTCTPSARLEQEYAESQSAYADEGTFAHELAEIIIREKAYHMDLSNQIERLIATREGELYYNEEMHMFCEEYAEFVVEYARNAPSGSVLIQEAELDVSHYIPGGFGHVDNAIIGDDWMTVIDLKYGKGVPVDAEENKQMMVYSLGAYRAYDFLYDIQNIRMIIYQPRIGNISTWEISVKDLLRWANEVLKPGAKAAWNGEGELVAGDHCRFCRVRATCKEVAKVNLQLAARDFDPPTLADEQVSKILLKAKQIKNWITAVENYALQQALKGKEWLGMKIVQGRSVRKYKDEKAVLEALEKSGADVNKLFIKKPLGITKMSKQLTKLQFQSIIEPLLHKPPGKPTLVSLDDKRAEWNREEAAALDFDEVTEDDE